MPPGFGGFPSSSQMIQAVIYFTALTTPIAVLLWYGIRRLRQRPMRWWLASIGSAFTSVAVSGIDVSCGTTSGIFSIFAAIAIPVFVAIVLLIVSVAAVFIR